METESGAWWDVVKWGSGMEEETIGGPAAMRGVAWLASLNEMVRPRARLRVLTINNFPTKFIYSGLGLRFLILGFPCNFFKGESSNFILLLKRMLTLYIPFKHLDFFFRSGPLCYTSPLFMEQAESA